MRDQVIIIRRFAIFSNIISYFVLLVNILSYIVVYYNIWGDIMKPLKEKISITIDGDLLEKLKLEAENDERSLSQYINLVLRKHIDSKQK